MERRKPADWLDLIATQATLAALATAAVAPIALLVSLVPRPQVLPVLCLVALTGSALVALAAWWLGAPRHGDHVTIWDIARALAFIGFAAGMLSELHAVLQLVGLEPMRN